jgi:hypothetical protein
MKLITLLSFVLMQIMASAQTSTLPIKIYAITAVKVESGFTTNVIGKELSAFAVPSTANSVKMSIQVPIKDFKKYRLQSQLHLQVLDVVTKAEVLNSYWSTLYKDTILKTDCYFPPGNYLIQLTDNNEPHTLFATRTIQVSGAVKKNGIVVNNYTYDPAGFKLWTCKSVDDVNWKPIGVITKIKAGGCATFFFDSKEKIKNPGTMRWKIFRTDASGKETFVAQHDQTSVLEEWRRMYFEECNEFGTPGQYTIYLAVKNESEPYYGFKDTTYFAKASILVE